MIAIVLKEDGHWRKNSIRQTGYPSNCLSGPNCLTSVFKRRPVFSFKYITQYDIPVIYLNTYQSLTAQNQWSNERRCFIFFYFLAYITRYVKPVTHLNIYQALYCLTSLLIQAVTLLINLFPFYRQQMSLINYSSNYLPGSMLLNFDHHTRTGILILFTIPDVRKWLPNYLLNSFDIA